MASYNYPSDFTGTYWRVIDGDVYVSSIADEAIADGSPGAPFKTIQAAVNAASQLEKIVVGTGTYREFVRGQNKSLCIEGDGVVVMLQLQGTAFSEMGTLPQAKLKNIQIKCYTNAVAGPLAQIEDCLISESRLQSYSGNLFTTIIKDSTLHISGNSTLKQCTLINVDGGETQLNPQRFTILSDNIFDATTKVALFSSVTTEFDYCDQVSGSTIRVDDVDYADPTALNAAHSGFQSNGVALAPGFSYETGCDYTVNSSSGILSSGSVGQHLGALGLSYSQFHTPLGTATLTNVQKDATTNQYTVIDANSPGTIETAEIDLGDTETIGRVAPYAEQLFEFPPTNSVVDSNNVDSIPNMVTYEMRFSDAKDGVFQEEWKTYIWNRQPRQDVNNKSNAELDFDLLTSHALAAQYLQFRVTLVDSTCALALESNGEVLLENGCSLLLEDCV